MKIVCLGDSITYGYNIIDGKETQAPINYPHYLEQKLSIKYSNVEVVNSGEPGWQIKQANLHLYELVLNYKPDICFIMYGINDMRGSIRGGLKVSKKSYFQKLNEVILKLQLNNIKVVLMTPICIENDRVSRLSKKIVKFAATKKISCIDINKYTRLEIAKSNENLSEVIPDGVHFREDWYYVIGKIILEQYFGVENEK